MTEKNLTFKIDWEVKDKFKIACIKAGKTMAEVLAELIIGYTDDEIEI